MKAFLLALAGLLLFVALIAIFKTQSPPIKVIVLGALLFGIGLLWLMSYRGSKS